MNFDTPTIKVLSNGFKGYAKKKDLHKTFEALKKVTA